MFNFNLQPDDNDDFKCALSALVDAILITALAVVLILAFGEIGGAQ